MKRIAFLLIVVSGIMACNTADKKADVASLTEEEKQKAAKDSSNYTSIQWLDSTYSKLGVVKKGEVIEVGFRFKNTGDKPLIITKVKAECGCTSTEKHEQPYAPGAEGVIKAKFDSKAQHVGPHKKYVTVTANTKPNPIHQLNFSVEITE